MKKNIAFSMLLSMLFMSSCTPIKRAQTGLARAIAGSEVVKLGTNEVYCSEGKVCAEVDVLSIVAEDRDGGRVKVVLKNRTGNTALVQIRLQIKDPATGEVITETRPENFPLPPTQEKTYEMAGLNRKGAVVRVLLNTAG